MCIALIHYKINIFPIPFIIPKSIQDNAEHSSFSNIIDAINHLIICQIFVLCSQMNNTVTAHVHSSEHLMCLYLRTSCRRRLYISPRQR